VQVIQILRPRASPPAGPRGLVAGTRRKKNDDLGRLGALRILRMQGENVILPRFRNFIPFFFMYIRNSISTRAAIRVLDPGRLFSYVCRRRFADFDSSR